MEFRILGSLEVVGRDGPIALGGPKRRGLLALLLVKRGQLVAADRIVEELADGDAERTVGTVHTYVSQLRKLLVGADGVTLTTRRGWLRARPARQRAGCSPVRGDGAGRGAGSRSGSAGRAV